MAKDDKPTTVSRGMNEGTHLTEPDKKSLGSDPATQAEQWAKEHDVPQVNTDASVFRGGDFPTVIGAGVVTTDAAAHEHLIDRFPPLKESIPAQDPTPAKEFGDPDKPAYVGQGYAERANAADVIANGPEDADAALARRRDAAQAEAEQKAQQLAGEQEEAKAEARQKAARQAQQLAGKRGG